MQIVADRIPVLLKTISLRFKEQLLESAVELPDGLLFVDAFVALQAFNDRVTCGCDRLGKCSLSAARWPFDDDRLVHSCGEVNHLQRDRIDHVLCRIQTMSQFVE